MMAGALLLKRKPRQIAGLALVFGVFYVGLAVLGVAVYHPIGLQLDFYENAFHWTVGPPTLGLGLAGLFWPETSLAPGRVARNRTVM